MNLKVTRSLVCAAALAVGAVVPAFAQQIVLKVHHPLPANATIATDLIQGWCDKIEAESGKKLKCQIYPAMTLGGSPPQLFDQARDGIADIVWTLQGYSSGRFPKSEVFELPFLTKTTKGSSEAFYRYVEKNAMDEYKGVKPLLLHTSSGPALHVSLTEPPTRLEALKGLKLRSPGRQGGRMITALGASPVQMPLPSLTEAMAKGVVDGALVTWEAAPSAKLEEVSKSSVDVPPGEKRFLNAIFILGMNQSKYDSLSPELKKVIDDNSGAKMSAWAANACCADKYIEAAKKLFKEHGVSISYLTDDEYKRWVTASEPVVGEWIAALKAKGVDGQALLKDAKALLDEYDR